MIKEGKAAPAFTLPASDGTKVSLSKLKGAPVILYFYPKDMTPGCTQEACDFRDMKAKLARRGARVLGVSPDPVESHERFRNVHRLNFLLLSDENHKVAEKYGAWGEKMLYGRKVTGLIRSTFVIDAKGVVRKVFPRVRVQDHAERVLEAIDTLA
jgi:peroxiredoxin Q/BCP